MKKWRCTVCGYIHTGKEPPEKCPVCGSDRSKYVEIPSIKEPVSQNIKQANTLPNDSISYVLRVYHYLTGQISRHHIHPISVHIPNGLLPVSVIFIVLSQVFDFDPLARAAFYNMRVVLIAMPIVLFSGYIEWQNRYKGKLSYRFVIKMICGSVVLLSSLILVTWQILYPSVMEEPSMTRWGFLLLCFLMLAAAFIAGYHGGKLVFKGK